MTVGHAAYIEQLGTAFDFYIKRMDYQVRGDANHKAHLASIAVGDSAEVAAERMGLSVKTVWNGRALALAALAKAMGAEDRRDYPALRRAILAFLTPGTMEYLPEFTKKARPAHV